MKIALCQLNTVTGNVAHNVRLVLEALDEAAGRGAKLAVFPEMTVTGYPPKDLLEYAYFVADAEAGMGAIQERCRTLGVGAIVGTVHTNVFGGKKDLLNAAAHVSPDGQVRFAFKKLLPTYDVFDEHRYFRECPADTPPLVVEYPDPDSPGGVLRIGVSICEDIWNDSEFWKGERAYEHDPIERIAAAGAGLVVNVSASPFVVGKPHLRHEMLRHVARRWNLPVLLLNQVGGCDQIIFDGGSCVVMPDGSVPAWCGWFADGAMEIWDTACRQHDPGFNDRLAEMQVPHASIHAALKVGLNDYLRKTGFSQVIVGNSGGIDSATVLALAVDTLGPDNVISVSMPGPYTSDATRADSAAVAARLAARHVEVPISELFHTFQGMASREGGLTDVLFGGNPDLISTLADENLQARLRGLTLMWLSNAYKSPRTLVLSTGNKSEVAVGYCTLYGDMAGGLALISDLPKMMVYRLARHLNSTMGNPIPDSILNREPTAELAPNQKDSDSLPPYPMLDEIIRRYVEERESVSDIVAAGVAGEQTVRRVTRLIDNAEYKRQQAAPGLKVTSKAFGVGRRMPIARG